MPRSIEKEDATMHGRLKNAVFTAVLGACIVFAAPATAETLASTCPAETLERMQAELRAHCNTTTTCKNAEALSCAEIQKLIDTHEACSMAHYELNKVCFDNADTMMESAGKAADLKFRACLEASAGNGC